MASSTGTANDKPASKPAAKAKPTGKGAAAKPSAKPAPTAAGRAHKPADSLPNRVRLHREAADISPKELAAKIGHGWTASTVRRIERGDRKATVGQQADLAAALGQPTDVLFWE